jgi:hypothetical protein
VTAQLRALLDERFGTHAQLEAERFGRVPEWRRPRKQTRPALADLAVDDGAWARLAELRAAVRDFTDDTDERQAS